jgi:lysophospholipase L1-like esterase
LANFILAVVAVIAAGCTQPSSSEPGWVASWGASPFAFQSFGAAAAPPAFENQTVRQVLRVSVGGEQIRVRFSNEIGTAPLLIGAASIALAATESAVQEGSLRPLTFGGASSIRIPPGAPALSDPVDLTVGDLGELAVSLYLPEETAPSTVHMGRTAFVSAAGDFTQAAALPDAEKSTTAVFLTGIYVKPADDVGVIVALGDSITDGAASTPYTYNSWPDHLAQRLLARGPDAKKLAVVNHGISGNQVLRDGAGDSALARFDRDVLATPGLTHVILLEGINDIGTGGFAFPGTTGPAPEMRSAADIVVGYQQLIARARSHSPPVKIFGATLTPFEGTFAGYYTPEKDRVRMEVNEWIRSSGMFDAVVDFEKAIQDPDNPGRMLERFDSGDKLHPGDAGYLRMAESVDLTLFD